jgi:hypothetical protein
VNEKMFIRVLFCVTFVVLVSATLGAILQGTTSPLDYQMGMVLFMALGVGAGLWALSEWKSGSGGKPKDPPDGGQGPA